MKHCTQDERNAVFVELRPHFITLASNTYAVHLVTKMLDNGKHLLPLFDFSCPQWTLEIINEVYNLP